MTVKLRNWIGKYIMVGIRSFINVVFFQWIKHLTSPYRNFFFCEKNVLLNISASLCPIFTLMPYLENFKIKFEKQHEFSNLIFFDPYLEGYKKKVFLSKNSQLRTKCLFVFLREHHSYIVLFFNTFWFWVGLETKKKTTEFFSQIKKTNKKKETTILALF